MQSFDLQKNVSLAPYTTFKVGGNAECFVEVDSTDQLLEVLRSDIAQQNTSILSYGSNTLISDTGISGLTICARGGSMTVNSQQLVVDAGVWWDDVVVAAIEHGLWGIELMSQVPGSVGAATYINITAYGQSIGPRIEWVEIWDKAQQKIVRVDRQDLHWDYKESIFQTDAYANAIILRVCLELHSKPHDELTYQKALDVAEELSADTTTLAGRRATILEARERAGSIWKPDDPSNSRTAGSFFRNPVIPEELVESIIQHDETGKTAEQIRKMNQVHGGSTKRVSAAHVMLAAGFHRGQQWGAVKLNDKNLLKIEALEDATAAEVYAVAQKIISTCQDKLGITLQPEAEFIGDFNR